MCTKIISRINTLMETNLKSSLILIYFYFSKSITKLPKMISSTKIDTNSILLKAPIR